MRAVFRGLMVPVFFLLFIALAAAVAAAVVALGPILIDGLAPAALPTLLPAGGGTPSPWLIAAGLGVVAALFIAMIAMLISESAETVGAFARRCVMTALWFAVILGGGFAVYLHGKAPAGLVGYAPAALAAAGILVGTAVTAILLAKPFLWWVSEKPPAPRRAPAPVEPLRTEPVPPPTDEPVPAI